MGSVGPPIREDADPLRPRLTNFATAVGLAATGSVFLLPSVRFAYYSPEFHVGLETAAGLTAALVAFLIFGRLRINRVRSNWALVYSLLLFALINLGLSAVPAMINTPGVNHWSVWATAVGRVVSAAAFTYAAFASDRPLRFARFSGATVLAGAAATVAVVALLVWRFQAALPPGVTEIRPTGGASPLLDAHAGIMFVQIVSLLLYTATALGFIRRSERTGDQLVRWLAAGAMMAAFSRLHYVLYPSLYSHWVYSGDVLRLGFYLLLLVGAVAEIRRYWHGLAQAAAAEERRRIARDLHDGLAQELAFMTVQTRWLQRNGADPETLRSVTAAADRALDESRRAIAALTRPVDEPLEVALAQAAEEVGDRVGTPVRLDLEAGVDVRPEAREDLIRIAREAIANAGRHSHADEVVVRLSVNGRVRLEVSDNGIGFDVEQPRGDRFGLVSMRERADALDAEFVITSSPGRGTSVEVALP